jgi:hypothetical protein
VLFLPKPVLNDSLLEVPLTGSYVDKVKSLLSKHCSSSHLNWVVNAPNPDIGEINNLVVENIIGRAVLAKWRF